MGAHRFKEFRLVQREDPPFEWWTAANSVKWIMGTKETPHQTKHTIRVLASLPMYLGSIQLLHLMKDPKPFGVEPPSFARFAGEVAFGVWAYDFIFFWMHLAMHIWPSKLHGHTAHHSYRSLKLTGVHYL